MSVDWVEKVRRRANAQGGANSVVLTAREYVQFVEAAEALRELVALWGGPWTVTHGGRLDAAMERARRALAGEAP